MLNENLNCQAEQIIDQLGEKKTTVKYCKKERGLIERSINDEKIILTEDNRQVLFG